MRYSTAVSDTPARKPRTIYSGTGTTMNEPSHAPAAGELADIGLIGLAVMGENLALNMESRGFRVAVYNRTVSQGRRVRGRARARARSFIGARSLQEFVAVAAAAAQDHDAGQGRAARSMS